MDTNGIGQDDQIHWVSKKFNSKSYTPLKTCSDTNFISVNDSIDIVLLCANDHTTLESYTIGLKPIINKETIILIDSTYASLLEDLILKSIPNVAVLSIISEVDVQILPTQTGFTYNHIGDKVATTVGFTSSVQNQLVENTLKGNGTTGGKLTSMMESLRTFGVYPSNVVTIGQRPSITCLCWKSILSFTTFEVLSLIYGRLSTNDSIHTPIIKGIFKEVLKVAYETCGKEIPDPNDPAKLNAFFKQLVTDFNQKHSNYQIKGETGIKTPHNDNALDSPFCLHAFKNKSTTYVDLNLKQIINLGKSLKIDCPRLECIYSFYNLVQSLNDAKNFDWVSKEYYIERQFLNPPNQQKPLQRNSQETAWQYNQQKSNNSSYVSLQTGHSQPQMIISQDMLTQFYSNASLIPKKQTIEINDGKIVSGTGLNHPRFSELPTNLPNGKSVGYKQVKNAIYKSTKGTTDAHNFGRAHEFIYQYGNLNNTFEVVNNRYGGVDSLSYFKESKLPGKIENLLKDEVQKSGGTVNQDIEDDNDDQDDDMEMASANEEIVR